MAHIYVEYIHIFVEIRGRGGVWGRTRHSLARKPSVDSIGGVLLATHSLHPVVVPRVAQCHAALELVHGSRGVLGRCRSAALQEERVGFHLAHQIVAAHDRSPPRKHLQPTSPNTLYGTISKISCRKWKELRD